MSIRKIAPAAAIGGEPIIRGTEISGSNNDRRPWNTPAEVLHAPDLKAGAADLPLVEQRRTHPRRGFSVATFLEVAIAASAADGVSGIGGGIVSSSS